MIKINAFKKFQYAQKFANRNIYNYDIGDLVDSRKHQEKYPYIIEYDIILSNGVNLQRDFVWTYTQKQELIFSILKGIKLPLFHVIIFKPIKENNQNEARYFRIIDGKQRLKTLEEFFENKFPITIDDEEVYFQNFDEESQSRFKTTTLDFNVYFEYEYEDPKENKKLTDEELIQWFYLVNYAGTPQDEKHYDKLIKSLEWTTIS